MNLEKLIEISISICWCFGKKGRFWESSFFSHASCVEWNCIV